MEKNKLKLNELKVNSFVTKLNKNEAATVDGGATPIIIVVTVSIASLAFCPISEAGSGDVPVVPVKREALPYTIAEA